MPRSAAFLLFTGALAAQSLVAPAPHAPVQAVSLSVDERDSNRAAVKLDPQQVLDDLTTFFLRNGIPVLPASLAEGTEGAYSLEVSPITLQYSEGTCLLSVSQRLRRHPAAGAVLKEAPREWSANYMAAQVGEEGLLFETRQIILSMAAHLVRMAKGADAAELPAQTLAPPAQAAAPHRPAPDHPKPVDVEFSQVRVKTQPPAPPYPTGAKERQQQGTVVVHITVDPDGRPVRAVAASGPPELKATALRYAMQWLFEPARIGGEPQWARFKLTMPFRLRQALPPPDRIDSQRRR